MITKISWAAAIVVAGTTFIVAGCQTAPEERPSASSASTEAAPRASSSDADRTERAGAMGTATTEQQSRSTEGDQTSTSSQSRTTGRADEMASGATTETPFEITGRVDSVDESNIEIAGKTLKIDSSTSVMKGGIGATLDDIKEGDEVRASLSGSGDEQPKAVRIEVMSPTTGGPAPSDTGAAR